MIGSRYCDTLLVLTCNLLKEFDHNLKNAHFLCTAAVPGFGLVVGVNAGNAATGNETASRVVQALPMVDDFEGGLPAAWFQYGDYGSGTAIATNVVPTDTVPGLPAAGFSVPGAGHARLSCSPSSGRYLYL